jgi:hypothetical protein
VADSWELEIHEPEEINPTTGEGEVIVLVVPTNDTEGTVPEIVPPKGAD